MRLEELYPYWSEVHEDLLDALSCLTEEHVRRRPHDRAASIRQIVLEFARTERFFMGHLAGGLTYEAPSSAEHTDGPALMELVRATREVTRRVVAPLSASGLKSVRTVPADTAENRPESNMPVAWLIWHVLREEIACLAQIELRRQDEKMTKPGRWTA